MMASTCANACLNGCDRGMIRSEVWDDDTRRWIPRDYLCDCNGRPCMSCTYGMICEVSGRDYSDEKSTGTQFWYDDREDYERWDDHLD